jgi:hypothetical protein
MPGHGFSVDFRVAVSVVRSHSETATLRLGSLPPMRRLPLPMAPTKRLSKKVIRLSFFLGGPRYPYTRSRATFACGQLACPMREPRAREATLLPNKTLEEM